MSSDGGPEEGREREEAAGDAWQALYRLVFEREGQQRFHEACDAVGLAPGGLKALLRLAPDQPVPMRDLAEYFRCDPSYVTSLVDGLEAAGLAERRSHPTDRRVKMVALSAAGVDALGQARKILGQPPTSFARLSTADLRRLRSLLSKLDEPEPPPAG
jgi:DNA-binding MarR family transcriptional regulator